MKTGLKLAAQKGYAVKGIGIDTWGVDFGLIDKHGNLLEIQSVTGMQEQRECRQKYSKCMDEHRHYAETGIQVMPINTLFQLYSMKQKSRCTVGSCPATFIHARSLQLFPRQGSQ